MWTLPETQIGDKDDLEGAVKVAVYHGTTHSFDRFDRARGRTCGQFGNVIYLTTCETDAAHNYTDTGPDVTNHVEAMAEKLAWEIEDDWALYFDAQPTQDQVCEMANVQARRSVIGDTPQVLSLYATFKTPFILNPNAGPNWPGIPLTRFPNIDDIDIEADAEDEEAWDAEYEEKSNALWEDLHDKIARAADAVGADVEDINLDFLTEPPATTNDLEDAITNACMYLECPSTGDILTNAFFAAFVEELGFDCIVLLNADRRFRTMDMVPGTHHIHLFNPDQVKGRDNVTFDGDTLWT